MCARFNQKMLEGLLASFCSRLSRFERRAERTRQRMHASPLSWRKARCSIARRRRRLEQERQGLAAITAGMASCDPLCMLAYAAELATNQPSSCNNQVSK
jgi:hypothetical protein